MPGLNLPGHTKFESDAIEFLSGDRLLIFSDGVSDSVEHHESLIDALHKSSSLSGSQASRVLIDDAKSRLGVFDDDATLMLICMMGLGKD